MMIEVTPILPCGGSGTRLWPLSRRGFPKQFATIAEPDSLFRQAATRLSGPGFAPPLVVTGADYRFIVAEQMAGLPPPAAILLEPAPRNTAPAILAAVLLAARADPHAVLAVAPCDHAIPDAEAFRATLRAAVPAALAGRIVTFGIPPDRAETGYGWLELPPDAALACAPVPLRRFVEKPCEADAARMLKDGRHLWNAGIFLFTAATFLGAVRDHAPDLLPPVTDALDGATPDLDFLRLSPDPWSRVRAVSVDHAVMERAANLSVMPHAGSWSDLGDWEAVGRCTPVDARGNATSGNVTMIDCDGTILRSEPGGPDVVAIGLSNLIAVATTDAILIADRSAAQKVGQAVAVLRTKGARTADRFPRDHRPWGWFDTLALGDRFRVKRIHVHPGAALSLQSHVHRAEHWIVVAGTARVTIGDRVSLVTENQSVYVPLGVRHRLENPGKLPVLLIEVQTGAYLDEDDITRHADDYARS